MAPGTGASVTLDETATGPQGGAKGADRPKPAWFVEAVSVTPAARTLPASSQPKPQRSAIARKTALQSHPAVLNARDAANYLGISVSTLKAWRRTAIGPPHTMLGARMIG